MELREAYPNMLVKCLLFLFLWLGEGGLRQGDPLLTLHAMANSPFRILM